MKDINPIQKEALTCGQILSDPKCTVCTDLIPFNNYLFSILI